MKKMAGFPESFTSRYLLLLFLQLLTLGSAQFTVIGPAEPILALEGEVAELPCHLEPKMNAEDMEVRWFRSEISPPVYVYLRGQELGTEQMEEYRGRTALVRDTIDYGSVALRISSVKISDEGQYRCFFNDGIVNEQALLELQVVGECLVFPYD
ncbi:butyrophilin subfamily 2 member A2-like [Ornithorhynchus anatinus]|uniref:butyrophilin subfamily 2 member A2-like n=1 Tax=Ornithorhynchus anatinus TaxID=9258 RepID=UPI0019D47DDD|nr:butyrophilin subfamily 2 member A2-like [Ornithorhynchus anatinus]